MPLGCCAPVCGPVGLASCGPLHAFSVTSRAAAHLSATRTLGRWSSQLPPCLPTAPPARRVVPFHLQRARTRRGRLRTVNKNPPPRKEPALGPTTSPPVQTENRLKSALLNSQDMSGAAGVHSSQLEAQLAAQSTSLEGPISDVLQLYAHAFRADAAQTDTMARRTLASINPNRASAGAEKALRLSDDLTRTLAQSVKRFLSIVTVRPSPYLCPSCAASVRPRAAAGGVVALLLRCAVSALRRASLPYEACMPDDPGFPARCTRCHIYALPWFVGRAAGVMVARCVSNSPRTPPSCIASASPCDD